MRYVSNKEDENVIYIGTLYYICNISINLQVQKQGERGGRR